jgi:tetratricopeptide (TPR) repeat protein
MEYWYNKKFSKAKVFYYFISKNSSDKEMALTSLERALRCEFRLRNYDVLEQALETLNGQNSASEDYVDKVLTICGVYIKANDPALALPYVNSALQASPDAEKTKRLLEIKAKCYAAMGADEQANAILDKIAQSGATDEEFLEALNNTADKYREKKRYEKSIELYQEVLNSNSSQDQKLDARVGIVRSNLKLGNDPNVAAAVKTICDDFADNEKLGRGIITIAEDYYYAKKIELARELSILAHEHTKNPEIAGEGAYIVALCSKKLKDESTQMKYYHIIMEKSPKSLYAYRVPFRMASIYMRQGNYEQAEYWFKKQRQLYDDPSTGGMATFGLAKLYKYGMNDLAKAAEVLENHKQWYPSGPDIRHVYLELAACYQKMGKTEKAVAELQSALEKYTEENYVKRYNKLLSEIQKGSN